MAFGLGRNVLRRFSKNANTKTVNELTRKLKGNRKIAEKLAVLRTVFGPVIVKEYWTKEDQANRLQQLLALAGFSKGPNILKKVLKPNSFLIAPTCRMAG